jgi:hypothetical protein
MLTVRLAALRGPGWEDLNPYKTDIKSLLSDPESPYRMIVLPSRETMVKWCGLPAFTEAERNGL